MSERIFGFAEFARPGRRLVLGSLTAAGFCASISRAAAMEQIQSPDDADQPLGSNSGNSTPPAEDKAAMPAPGPYTLGGMQFWGDVCYLRGFRIQQNVLSGHFRLLDAENRRYASGTETECRSQLERIRAANQLTPDTGHAVIYVHGIGRSSRSLKTLRHGMPDNNYTHVLFEYPSTRVPLRQCAEFLASVIQSLTDVDRISFVVHSMGGLVVRRYLAEKPDPRLHRLVMMGTPNNGAELADMLRSNLLFRTLYGPAGQELVTDSAGTIRSLPVPNLEFGIVAGGRGDAKGFNRLLPGDNDGTVTVASARLAGAADFLLVPRIHSFLMTDETVISAVRCFLENGRFSMDRPPAPIPPVPSSSITPGQSPSTAE